MRHPHQLALGLSLSLGLSLLLATRSASAQASSTPASASAVVSNPIIDGDNATARAGPGAGTGDNSMVELARGYKKMAQTILPLLVGFKATGLLVIAIALTKAILLKALFLSTTALAVAALVALKKFLSGAMQHQDRGAYTFQHHDLSHVPYLHPEYITSETQTPHQPQPHAQVTYLGGSYGLHTVPYAAPDDIQGLYSSQSVVPAVLPASQLQQLHEHQALLAQQLQLHQLQIANHTQPHLSRRKLSALAATALTEATPYPYRLAQSS